MRGNFTLKSDATYRMPVHFIGYPFDNSNRVVYSDVMAMSVMQRSSGEALAQYVPSDFELLDENIHWTYMNCRGVDFLSHGEYRIFMAGVQVRFKSENDDLVGEYPLVIWEDNAHPILGGREEDGMPKVFASITPDRHFNEHWFAACSLYDETMARYDFHDEREASPDEVAEMEKAACLNCFGMRYFPNADRAGAAYSDIVLYPQEMHPKRVWFGSGSVTTVPVEPWYRIPNMAGIVGALSALPCHGFFGAFRSECWVRLCVADSRKLR